MASQNSRDGLRQSLGAGRAMDTTAAAAAECLKKFRCLARAYISRNSL
jgi:hypothetical protein